MGAVAVEAMGIVQRGERKYAYQSIRREDGRKSSRYLGSGPAAEMIEAANEARAQERAAIAATRRSILAGERMLRDLNGACEVIVTAAFLAGGFHRHDRGRWRRRR